MPRKKKETTEEEINQESVQERKPARRGPKPKEAPTETPAPVRRRSVRAAATPPAEEKQETPAPADTQEPEAIASEPEKAGTCAAAERQETFAAAGKNENGNGNGNGYGNGYDRNNRHNQYKHNPPKLGFNFLAAQTLADLKKIAKEIGIDPAGLRRSKDDLIVDTKNAGGVDGLQIQRRHARMYA